MAGRGVAAQAVSCGKGTGRPAIIMAKCLVLDDSESMREIAAEILVGLGHDVTEAADAEAGLAACSDGVDLVLLDWDLPKLGALDVLKGAAALSPRPAIVLCAAEHDERQFSLARSAGAGAYVLKPYDAQTVAAALVAVGVEPVLKVA